MKFTLEISCHNAAFGESEEDAITETRRILSEITERELWAASITERVSIRDLNGNKVGSIHCTKN